MFQVGEILAKYPKLEYITNAMYCENDEDCKCIQIDCVVDCANFIQPGPELLILCETIELNCKSNLDCKCINNTCTVTNNNSNIK